MKPVISIQYLRGLAAFLVLLQHVSYKDKVYSGGEFNLFDIGHMGVDIFFIISGFIMAYTFRPELGAVRFLYNRVLRIIPLYWLTSVIALIGYLYVPGLINGSKEPDILSSFFLLPSERRYLNPNGWTLSCEFLFYLVFSFSFLSAYRFRFVLPSIILACLAFIGLSHEFEEVIPRFIFSPMLVEFLFGMIIFQIYSRYSIDQSLNLVLLLASALLVLFSLFIYFSGVRIGLRIIDLGLPAFFICIFIVSLESRLKTNVSGILKSLGDSSYSLYLTHAFTIGVAGFLLSYFGLVGSSLFFSGTLILVSIISGYFCYRYVEVPMSAVIKTKLDSMIADINSHSVLWLKK
jgi:peptidoglycan/LPS O-acetylase OafA/YrhL